MVDLETSMKAITGSSPAPNDVVSAVLTSVQGLIPLSKRRKIINFIRKVIVDSYFVSFKAKGSNYQWFIYPHSFILKLIFLHKLEGNSITMSWTWSLMLSEPSCLHCMWVSRETWYSGETLLGITSYRTALKLNRSPDDQPCSHACLYQRDMSISWTV